MQQLVDDDDELARIEALLIGLKGTFDQHTAELADPETTRERRREIGAIWRQTYAQLAELKASLS